MFKKECRICYDDEEENASQFISPCACDGSRKYVHRECIEQWREIKHGLIDYDAWDDNIENGLDAMIKAHKYYSEGGSIEEINSLMKYNHVDVKIMLIIIKCFRKNF